MRWIYKTEGRRLARRERSWLESFDATILITQSEVATMLGGATARKLHVVGNGVPLPEDASPRPTRYPTVGFVGVMDYKPNVDAVLWFVDRCWGAIRDEFPSAGFRIVGRSPNRDVRKLANVPGVTVVGQVDDLSWELRGFDVSVAPMRIARGLQNKVLEAMAWNKAVVLSPQAAEGIDAKDGRDFVVADGAESTIREVRRLLHDQAERQRIGSAARTYVAQHHRWDDVLDQFEMIVTGAIARSSDRESVVATGPQIGTSATTRQDHQRLSSGGK
jgi:glycosyltransferase involved in cell wall biosynthesis